MMAIIIPPEYNNNKWLLSIDIKYNNKAFSECANVYSCLLNMYCDCDSAYSRC